MMMPGMMPPTMPQEDPATLGQAPMTDQAFGGTMLTKILAQMLAEQELARVEASKRYQLDAMQANKDVFGGPMGGAEPDMSMGMGADPMMGGMPGMPGMGGGY